MGEGANSSKACKSCGTVNSAASKFCKKCGSDLQILAACPQCGSKLDSDSVFCQECGFNVTKRVETLPATVTMRRLPLGLEILIVLGALGAALYFFSGVMLLYGIGSFGRVMSAELASQMTTVGVLWLLVGAFLALVSWGLWNLREWARKALVVNTVLVLIGTFFNQVQGLLGLVYSVIILWYVYQPHIKSLFEAGTVGRMPTLTPSSGMKTLALAPLSILPCPSCGKKGKPGTKFCVKCGAELKEVGS